MSENQVLEDQAMQGLARLRQQHGYPTRFRQAAGTYHAFIGIVYGIGGASVLAGRDAMIDMLVQQGVGIQARSSVGMFSTLLGGIALAVAVFHAWVSYSFYSGRQQVYGLAVIVNVLTFAGIVLSRPTTFLSWVQLIAAVVIAGSLLLDPRVKAFYYRGPLKEAWWAEELKPNRGHEQSRG